MLLTLCPLWHFYRTDQRSMRRRALQELRITINLMFQLTVNIKFITDQS
jgi:hypothetical protein